MPVLLVTVAVSLVAVAAPSVAVAAALIAGGEDGISLSPGMTETGSAK